MGINACSTGIFGMYGNKTGRGGETILRHFRQGAS